MRRKEKIRLKSPDEIKRIQDAGDIIAEIFRILVGMTIEGQTTAELDAFIEDAIYKRKGRPSFKTVADYHHATCISLNDEVVHGVPSRKKIIKKGALVKVDIGVVRNGYFADACRTFLAEPVRAGAKKLSDTAAECLRRGVGAARPGGRLGDIGAVIQAHAEENGFSVVRDFTGHGVGFAVHELPNIPHYGRRGTGMLLKEGMVLAIEPMLNEGKPDVIILEDGWTAVTADGRLSAQFEHTVAVTGEGPRVLTGAIGDYGKGK